jgi:hypothetical protein
MSSSRRPKPFAKFKNWLKYHDKKSPDQRPPTITCPSQRTSSAQPSQVSQSTPKHAHPTRSLQSLPSHLVLPSLLQSPVSSAQPDPRKKPPSEIPESDASPTASPPKSSHDTIKSVYHGAKMALGIIKGFAEPLPPLKTAVEGILKIIEIVEVKSNIPFAFH